MIVSYQCLRMKPLLKNGPKVQTAQQTAALQICGYKLNFIQQIMNCVVIGNTGSGKTTLYNLLCGTSFDMESMDSCTRTLVKNQIIHKTKKPIFLIDTPGNNATEEVFHHSVLIYHALTSVPINTIFVVVSIMGGRVSDTFKNKYIQHKKMLKKDLMQSKVVFLFSGADQVKFPRQEILKKLEQAAKNSAFRVKGMLVYSKNDNPQDLTSRLEKLVESSEARSLKPLIDQERFLLNFKLVHDYELSDLFQRLQEQLNEIKNNMMKFVEQTVLRESGMARDNLLTQSVTVLKLECKKVLEKFQKKFRNCEDPKEYLAYVQLQKIQLVTIENFTNEIKKNFSYASFGDRNPFKFIKRCPNCRQIWWLVTRCPNTRCGEIEQTKDSQLFKNISLQIDYGIKYVKGVFKRVTFSEVKQEIKTLIEEDNRQDSKQQCIKTSQKKAVKPRGCGASFNFDDLPMLSPDQICKLFETENEEALIQMLNADYLVEGKKVHTQKMAKVIESKKNSIIREHTNIN